MKHSFRNLFAITCMALSFTLSSCSDDDEGDDVTPDQEQAGGSECLVDVEAVDLGLPSGTRWAPFNLGAEDANDFGDLVSWGETEPKSYYYYDTYKYWDAESREWLKYTDAGKRFLDPDDDAATVNWGSDWCMPTIAQWEELKVECDWTWREADDVNSLSAGYTVTSKTSGNSIFLPAAGFRIDADYLIDGNYYGYYWASELYPNYDESGAVFTICSERYYTYEMSRWSARSVRAVATNNSAQ